MKIELISSLLLVGLTFTGCNDDKESLLPSLQESTYSSPTTMHLTYCGEEMPGKYAKVIPDGEGGAQLMLFSEFDLSQLSLKGIEGNLMAPGVIPGDVTTTIPLKFTPGDKCRLFSGESKTAEMSFNYSGKLYADSLVLDITDALLDNQTLAGTAWQLSPIQKNKNGIGYKSLPFHIVWEVTPAPDEKMDLSGLLEVVLTAPCIPVYNGTAYSSVAQLLSETMKSVAFLGNGNVVFTYMSTLGGAAHLATLNGNTVQYTPAMPNYIKFYVNPLSVAGLAMRSGIVTDLYSKYEEFINSEGEKGSAAIAAVMPIMKSFISELAPEVASGIPMTYSKSDGNLTIYFDTETAIRLIKSLYQSIASDPKIMESVMNGLKQYPELAEQLPQINQLISQIPAILEQTTKFELGFNLIPYSED